MGQKKQKKKQKRQADAKPQVPEVQPAVDPFERFTLPILILFGGAILAVYALTLYRSVPGGDSGELIVAAYRLGVAHPPGYPLFTLLGKLSTYLPIGSIAWRVNFLTAVFGALAATVLVRATWKLNRSLGAGILAGGLFAFSPLVWRYAIGAEVFSLNNLFAAILVALLIAFATRPSHRTLRWYFFVFGLGLSNHQTLLFVGAPVGIWMLVRARDTVFRPRRLIQLAACWSAGLLPYLYLFLAPSRDPVSTWRGISTVSDFLSHVLRKQYGTFRLGATERRSSLFESLASYFSHLPWEMLFVGVALPALSLGLLALKPPRLEAVVSTVLKVILLALATYLLLFNLMANLPLDEPLYYHIQSRFWQQANLVLFLLAGTGFAWLLGTRLRAGAGLTAVVALAVVAAQLGLHYGREDQSRNRLVSDLAQKTLNGLPRDALVISEGDLFWNSLRYKQVCEGLRPDVRLLDIEMLKAPWTKGLVQHRFEDVRLPGSMYRGPSRSKAGSYDLAALIDGNFGRFVILTNALDGDSDPSWKQRYSAWPEGVYDRIRAKDEVVDLDRYVAGVNPWTHQADLRSPPKMMSGSWEEQAWRKYLEARVRPGEQLLNHVVSEGLERRHLRQAGGILEAAVASGEPLPASVYLNLGIYYMLERSEDPEAVQKMVQAWNTYLGLVPRDDPRTKLVRQVLENPETAELKIGTY